ncbi:MAG TPA: hypothetical protein VLT58_07990 [Polyangia bacterium]|nr:hypothetical protein [Polyangia bacterium]
MSKQLTRVVMFVNQAVLVAAAVVVLVAGCGSSLPPGAGATGGNDGSGGNTIDAGSLCYDAAASDASGRTIYSRCSGPPDGGDLCYNAMASGGNPGPTYSRCCPANPDCSIQPDGWPFYSCISRDNAWCTCTCQQGQWMCAC